MDDQDKIVKHYCQKYICINDINLGESLIKLSFILCLNPHINKSTWLTY